MATLAELFDQAIRYHQGGDLGQAETLYTQILRADPPADAAAPSRLHSGLARVHYNLANIQMAQQRLAEAAMSLRQALRLDPAHAWACNNLGIVLKQLGAMDEAASNFRRAADLRPDYVDAHYNLGIVFMDEGMLEDAVSCF